MFARVATTSCASTTKGPPSDGPTASPIRLPKENTSGDHRPVVAEGRTVTWSHWLRMAPSSQITVTRSDPLAPAPGLTVIEAGRGAGAQVAAGPPVLTRKSKSAAPG